MTHPLTYRIVAGVDHARIVRPLLEKLGEPPPHFLLSCAWIAETSSGEIVALSQLQSLPVVEPFKMLSAEYDGGEVLGILFNMTKEFILTSETPRVLMHTGHRAMQIALRREGAKVIEDRFLDWRR